MVQSLNLKILNHSVDTVITIHRTCGATNASEVELDHGEPFFQYIARELFHPITPRTGATMYIEAWRAFALHIYVKVNMVRRSYLVCFGVAQTGRHNC